MIIQGDIRAWGVSVPPLCHITKRNWCVPTVQAAGNLFESDMWRRHVVALFYTTQRNPLPTVTTCQNNMKRSDRLKDCETTVTIDLARFPRGYWTGSQNPFLKVDEHQLNDIESWIKSMIPVSDEYCVELIGRCPGPVSLFIGGLLRDMNCQKLTCINPGRGTFTVWDYTEAAE